jgi:hypothetical protein
VFYTLHFITEGSSVTKIGGDIRAANAQNGI